MKKKKKYTTEQMRNMPYSELRAYLDSMKSNVDPWKGRTKPNYKEMSYEEAVKANYGHAHFAVHKAEISSYKEHLAINFKKRRVQNESFHFFWSNESPFSQWYKTEFKAPIYLSNRPLSLRQRALYGNTLVSYSSAEQLMMYYKAVMFGDVEISNKILSTKNVKKIKELGREVSNFNQQIWDHFKHHVVRYATYCKFRNNKELLDLLLSTYPKTIVEASPYDKVWGIGLSEDDERAQQRSTWQGDNLLGEILTNFRDEYIEKKGNIPDYPLGSV